MTKFYFLCFTLCTFITISCAQEHITENLDTTKVFILPVEPEAFNWTKDGTRRGFRFRPSLDNSPDLPRWLSYTYSRKHKTGFLYGVPPNLRTTYKIEIIGINRDSYDTAHKIIMLNVTEKQDAAEYEVSLKIDNMNVEDMYREFENLLDVFRKVLWPEAAGDLYPTFLASAVELGARLPLRPNESDGVVVRLGSGAPFSESLKRLEEEVRPLWKLAPCPRELKRTTVDRHLRSAGFLLDWCSFRLDKGPEGDAGAQTEGGWSWEGGVRLVYRALIPFRSPSSDLVATTAFPAILLLVMALLLSLVLCFHHDDIEDHESDEFFDSLFFCDYFIRREVEESEETLTQFEAVQRATNSLRSMSNVRDSNQKMRMTRDGTERNRPQPPPYAAVRRVMNQDS